MKSPRNQDWRDLSDEEIAERAAAADPIGVRFSVDDLHIKIDTMYNEALSDHYSVLPDATEDYDGEPVKRVPRIQHDAIEIAPLEDDPTMTPFGPNSGSRSVALRPTDPVRENGGDCGQSVDSTDETLQNKGDRVGGAGRNRTGE